MPPLMLLLAFGSLTEGLTGMVALLMRQLMT
jgi:hypothetical protein